MGGKTIYALGFFDGVHLGHQALLAACRHLAAETGAAAGAVTFANHPDLLLGRQTPLLCSLADRQRLLQHFGMEQLVTLPFDDSLRTMPWQDFLLMLREEYGAAGFVCGEDFRFGHRGEGSAQALEEACREAGIPCSVIPDQTLDGRRISSTHIRHLLEQGETAQAVRFLGHPHILTGQVVRGRGLGHTMGIPTANLLPEEGVLCPRHGVYACKARLEGQTFLAVANIGNRPTVGGHRVTAEAWLLDFTGDLYGRELTLELHRFLRPEQKFASLEELRAEIQRNRAETMEFFKNQ